MLRVIVLYVKKKPTLITYSEVNNLIHTGVTYFHPG